MKAFLIAIALALVSPLARADQDTSLRRFALIVGSNDGGTERVKLRYARSDAQAVSRVLQELGGLSPENSILLSEPSRPFLREAFLRLRDMLAQSRQPGRRLEVLFYFSGHSDEEGLLLGGERLSYREIRRSVEALAADVHIAILDSCASGALTRSKGGRRRAPFQVDASAKVRGYAFLTSASAEEPAQESDRLKASFFTHYLVSGLRGAADLSHDGRVTLNEAYQYAFHQTLARTESTQAGPQHPNYDMRLAGSGDLVITDIRGTSARMVLPPDLEGRLFIRDAQGRLAAEVDKPRGRPLSLGLEPGEYQVTLERRGRIRQGTILLKRGETLLETAHLDARAAELTVTRGASPPEDNYRHYVANLSFVPGLAISGFRNHDLIQYFGVNVLGGYAAQLRGMEVAGLQNWEIESATGLQVAGLFNYVGGPLKGAQVAGVVNVASGEVWGAQVTGVVNVAKSGGKGVQVAPVANVSWGDLDGLQLGLVNVSRGRLRGVQLGLINYADDSPVSIGLVSIVRDGQIHMDLWAGDSALTCMALRLGGRYIYNLYAVGFNPLGDQSKWLVGLGLGGHIPLTESWFLDIDEIVYHINEGPWTSDLNLLAQVRIMAGYRFFPRLAIFAGVTANVLASTLSDGGDWRIWTAYSLTVRNTNIMMAAWPGFVGGVRF